MQIQTQLTMAALNSEYNNLKCQAVIRFYRHFGAHPPVSQHQPARDIQLLYLFQKLFSPSVVLTNISESISEDTFPSHHPSIVDCDSKLDKSELDTSVFEFSDSCSSQNTLNYNPKDKHHIPYKMFKLYAKNDKNIEIEYSNEKQTAMNDIIKRKESDILVGLVSNFSPRSSRIAQHDKSDKANLGARMSFTPKTKGISTQNEFLIQDRSHLNDAVCSGLNEPLVSQMFRLINEPSSMNCTINANSQDTAMSESHMDTTSEPDNNENKTENSQKQTWKAVKYRKRKMKAIQLTARKSLKRKYRTANDNLSKRIINHVSNSSLDYSSTPAKRRPRKGEPHLIHYVLNKYI